MEAANFQFRYWNALGTTNGRMEVVGEHKRIARVVVGKYVWVFSAIAMARSIYMRDTPGRDAMSARMWSGGGTSGLRRSPRRLIQATVNPSGLAPTKSLN